MPDPPSLLDFVNNVPHPLTAVLVQLAPHLALLARAAHALSWRRSCHDGLLVVAAWCALCLFADPVLRYLLPLVALLALPLLQRRSRSSPVPPTTETSLQGAVADLIAIQALLPSLPSLPPVSLPTLVRVVVVVYVPYLLLPRFIPLRVLVALAGTAFLTARSPPSILILSTLHRSAWVRLSLAYLVALLTGHPLPPRALSYQPLSTSPAPVPSLRFLFTLYENQRWWMGLDWTAALLPAERPSWSSAAHHPLSPPTAFTLPEPTSVFLPNPSGPGRIKRTATWTWEEPEWRVLVRKDGAGAPTRVERPLPSPRDETSQNGSRLLKAAGKMREAGVLGSGPDPESPLSEAAPEPPEEENALTTDPDGWVYGDNKWEGLSCKGGMGKARLFHYTRHRRWTRVAVVSETVEVVGDGEIGIDRPHHSIDAPLPPYHTSNTPAPNSPSSPTSEVHPSLARAVDSVTVNGVTTAKPAEEESPLRQRLRRALSKPSTPAP
ncbi:integral peroxisomal membrane peroxin-domain-containing protein [Collybia nuda]|uniref:Integral peroxisomal membrane peroxin-domain-containing protein n=1 Tax=Collybia nuda TaxID=64659 RepID=A0A9P5YE77_9AGAR|nr:integral peroxisomal membrane peroxin-domain-containing protein [Collybia nuda]